MTENSHDAFLKRLDQSRTSTFLVAQYLHKAGYNVTVPAFDYRDPNTNWEDHVDNGDLFIWKEKEEQHRIDVKHVSLDFTSRDDFKFPYMFVADIRAIKRANPFPLAYIIINKSCTHMAIVWGKTKDLWVERDVYASNTQKMITVMKCAIEHVEFRPLND